MPFHILWLLVVTGVAAGAFALYAASRKHHLAMMQEQAAKRSGQVRPGRLFEYPVLYFPFKNVTAEVRVDPGGRNRPPEAAVSISLPRPASFWLAVYPQQLTGVVGKWFGMQDIEVGDSLFDEKFIVRGDNEPYTCSFLCPEVRNALLQLADRQPSVSIEGNKVTLKTAAMPKYANDYDSLIDQALVIFSILDRLPLP